MDYLNIDKLQKVNQLAKELKGHGLANDMTDAYHDARQLTNSETELQFLNNVGDGGSAAVAQANPIQVPAAQEDNEEESSFLKQSGEELGGALPSVDSGQVLHLQKRLRESEARLGSVEDVVMKMQHAMNGMLQEIASLKAQKAVVEVRNPPREVQQQNTMEKGSVEIKTDAPKKEHPRQGKYKSEDVSIEDFFYFGNK